MEIKVLVVAVVKKDNSVLMRKKPEGSPPYTQTWYLFGADASSDVDPNTAIKDLVRSQAGIEIEPKSRFSWDTEIKKDIDGITKQFIYLDVVCDYISGDLRPGQGIERLEWVTISGLSKYDIVPPSIIVFKKLGYLI
jgi:hypothetical protein